MADRFITIKDAKNFTGKSHSTLRRFLDGIVKADDSPDRHLVLPTAQDAASMRAENQPFAWRISEELLRRHFLKPDDAASEAKEPGSGGASVSDSSELVEVLRESLAMLKSELDQKNDQIKSMNELQHESNVLMRELQNKLTLPAGKAPGAQTIDGQESKPSEGQKSTGESDMPKKRRFPWLFGR